MARDKRPIELRTVDDQPAVKVVVPRLGLEGQPVRLIPENKDTRQAPAARLELPNLEALDTRRSHQPGVEVLIATDEPTAPHAEEAWSQAAGQSGPVAWGWFALVGLVLAAAVIWSISHIRQAEPQVREEQMQVAEAAEESAASDRALKAMIEGMERQVKAFCEAGSLEAMLPLLRHPEQVRPLMERYYAQNPLQALGFKRVGKFEGAMMGGKSDFWVFTTELGDGQIRDILVEQDPAGRIAVDWETAVTYQPMNWNDYARQRPQATTMDFRVYIRKDNFFTHEFSDARQWASFRLTTPGGEETLFGYVPRGGPVEAALLALIDPKAREPAAAILRLTLPAGTQSRRGVLIDQVLSTSWVYEDPPASPAPESVTPPPGTDSK